MNQLNEQLISAIKLIADEKKIPRDAVADALKDGASIKPAVKDRETEYKLRNIPVLHAFGHGVGLDIHERPFLRSNTESIIKENAIIAIEPGVYSPGEYGMRIEDTFVVTQNGSTPLTHASKNYTVIKL